MYYTKCKNIKYFFFRNLRQTNSLDNQSETGSNRGRRPLSHHETTDDDSSDYSLTDDESLDGTVIKQKVSYYELALKLL